MNQYINLIFDLDGTLTNPQEGILNSLRHALNLLEFKDLPDFVPPEFIGPPLHQCFKKVYGLNDSDTDKAVVYFREYYGAKGLYENYPYEGIPEMLSALSDSGKSMFIATSKFVDYAWEIVRHFGLDKYIIDVKGADYKSSKSKSVLIKDLIFAYRLNMDETIMIGDTVYDTEGARETGISALSVGYGFSPEEILRTGNPDYYVPTVEELGELLLG